MQFLLAKNLQCTQEEIHIYIQGLQGKDDGATQVPLCPFPPPAQFLLILQLSSHQ